ncbi:MAG: Crp/Fnr family transcriptional regulator [Saprospiraceae bacterium]|nr:Crp/Fnr family transcriptional regulator [Saprospiraceae bacterium]
MTHHDLLGKMFCAVEQITPLSEQEKELIGKYFTPHTIKKGEIYQAEGEIPQYLNFVIDGLLRKFIYNEDGDDITLEFSLTPGVFNSYDEFIGQKPVNEYMQALKDCTLMRMHHRDFEVLLNKSEAVKSFTIKIMQIMIKNAQDRVYDMAYRSAAERYQKFIERNIFSTNAIPLMHISTYLGIRPQSLSRLRRDFDSRKTK